MVSVFSKAFECSNGSGGVLKWALMYGRPRPAENECRACHRSWPPLASLSCLSRAHPLLQEPQIAFEQIALVHHIAESGLKNKMLMIERLVRFGLHSSPVEAFLPSS